MKRAFLQWQTCGCPKPLVKRYAIFKSKLGRGNRRNLVFTGDLLRNFPVRAVNENRAKASLSTRKDRIKAWVSQKIEPWMVFSPRNKVAVVEATRRVVNEIKSRLVVESALRGKQR